MKIKTIVVGELEENCYLLMENDSCLVVDPGEEYEKIRKEIGSLSVLGVLITHHHFDHVGALNALLKDYKIPKYDFSNEEKEYKIGPFTFQIVLNPGHSKDSVRFVFEKERIMFVGDFVFQGTVGRCDLEGGNFNEMKESIRSLKKEKENYTLYPGHGPKTTLDQEKKYNMYFED